MPAHSSDGVRHIEDSLRSSLTSKEPSLDQRLVSSSKRILMQKIDFRPAEKSASHQLDTLRSKYVPLNAGKLGPPNGIKTGCKGDGEPRNIASEMQSAKEDGGEGLPVPSVVLYQPDKIRLDWPSVKHIGSGLYNLGNTCFLNSTLQCLTYTAPLVNYLCSDEHTQSCKVVGFCLLCELQRHIRRCFDNTGSSIKPQSIVQKLRFIAKHMHWGRQEDAHEFLRYVVDHMQKACLNGHSKLDRFSKETTVVNQIFGGYLRSQVLCLRCKARSNTYDPFLDISVDIKNVLSIQKALEKYVQPETLDVDNAYICTKCKYKVQAQKRFSIHKAPNVLTLQLKRFDCGRGLGGKVNKHVHFPEKFDMRPYMSSNKGEPMWYQLYAVLVHSGLHCNAGHYYCYVRSSNHVWYCLNDSLVSQVNVNRVLNAEAYLLFYIKHRTPLHSDVQKRSSLIGPKLPVTRPAMTTSSSSSKFGVKIANRPIGLPSEDLGKAIASSATATATSAGMSASASSSSAHAGSVADTQPQASHTATTVPPASQRNRLSFALNRPSKEPQLPVPPPVTKPPIIIQIKNGKVSYSSVTDKKANGGTAQASDGVAQAGSARKCPSLVPYNDDDSDTDVDMDRKVNGLTNGHEQKQASDAINKVKEDGAKPGDDKLARRIKKETGSPLRTMPFDLVMDNKLKATTCVPGAYGPLDKALLENGRKDRSLESTNGHFSDDNVKYIGLHREKDFGVPGGRSLLKRSLSDEGLSIHVLNPADSRVNATTRWHIRDPDAQVSPSMASESSGTSINSTTEWHVLGSKESKRKSVLPEAQHHGWTVTPTKAQLLRDAPPDATGDNGIQELEEGQLVDEKDPAPLPTQTTAPSLTTLKASVSDSCTVKSKPAKHPFKFSCFSTNYSPDVESRSRASEALAAHQNASHTTHNAIGSTDSNHFSLITESGMALDNYGDKLHKKHKKHKHKKHKKSRSRDVERENHDVENDIRSHDVDHESRDVDDEIRSREVEQRSRDVEQESRSWEVDPEESRSHGSELESVWSGTGDAGQPANDSSASDECHRHKKHKKKHKRSRHDDADIADAETLDTATHHHNGAKNALVDDGQEEQDDVPSKHQRWDGEDDTEAEYEWVEKTIETVHKEKQTQPEVTVQTWDQHISDGLKRSHAAAADGALPKLKAARMWDGTRNNNADVVASLEKSASLAGYGSQVSSWDGGPSQLQKEVEHERTKDTKRHWSDDYEEELDRGKTKKLKCREPDHPQAVHGYNPFQKFHDQRTVDKDWKNTFVSPERDHDNDHPSFSSANSNRPGYHPSNHHRNHKYPPPLGGPPRPNYNREGGAGGGPYHRGGGAGGGAYNRGGGAYNRGGGAGGGPFRGGGAGGGTFNRGGGAGGGAYNRGGGAGGGPYNRGDGSYPRDSHHRAYSQHNRHVHGDWH